MRPSGMGVRHALVLAAAGASIAACSQFPCTLIGAVSGVTFDFSQAAPRTGVVLIHACVRTKCQDQTVDPRVTDKILVTDDTLDGPGPVAVTLVIRTSTQRTIFSGTAKVTLKKNQPNGPKCPPTAWSGNVLALRAGTLAAR